MNLPNKLTLSRFGLTAIFLGAIFWQFPFNETAALVVFCVAGVTDVLDGEIARRRNLITNFGILMDPLADKIMTCSAFIAFVGLHYMPAWMVVIIVARELTITGLRLLAATKQRVLAAERYGKHKTISQSTAIIAVLVMKSHEQWGPVGKLIFGGWVQPFTEVAKWVTVALTFGSGCVYLWRNREVYLSDL